MNSSTGPNHVRGRRQRSQGYSSHEVEGDPDCLHLASRRDLFDDVSQKAARRTSCCASGPQPVRVNSVGMKTAMGVGNEQGVGCERHERDATDGADDRSLGGCFTSRCIARRSRPTQATSCACA